MALKIEIKFRRVRDVGVDNGSSGHIAGLVTLSRLFWSSREETNMVSLGDDKHSKFRHGIDPKPSAGL